MPVPDGVAEQDADPDADDAHSVTHSDADHVTEPYSVVPDADGVTDHDTNAHADGVADRLTVP
jgi:hypothetical protein